MTILKLSVFAFIISGLIKSSSAAEIYSATVEDGTPKTLKASTNIEKTNPHEQFLHEVARPVVTKKEITLKVESTETAPEAVKPEAVKPETPKQELPVAAEEAPAPSISDDVEKPVYANEVDSVTQKEISKDKNKKIEFDVVPQKHVADISRRLKYTNEILKRFGRAYDYKKTTLKELQKILAYLEKQNPEKTR